MQRFLLFQPCRLQPVFRILDHGVRLHIQNRKAAVAGYPAAPDPAANILEAERPGKPGKCPLLQGLIYISAHSDGLNDDHKLLIAVILVGCGLF